MASVATSKFRLSVVVGLASLSLTALMGAGCQSKSSNLKSKTVVPAGAPESNPPANVAPGAQKLAARDLDGKAYTLEGTSTTARAVVTNGENRRPVFTENNRIAFASRRASLERWQVFEADFTKNVERRISFDAGDAEPVAIMGKRLVIASSSDERKSGDRVLNEYREVFVPKPAGTPKPDGLASALQHLLLEHPAEGRKGTEWVRMAPYIAKRWIVSHDREFKAGLAVLIEGGPESERIYRFTISTKGREPSISAWAPLKIERPADSGAARAILDGRIFPAGDRYLWNDGEKLWTTNTKGGDARRIGDSSLPTAVDIAIDPSGQWIVFSSPSPSRGRNLLAVHQTGRCLKTLTELPGDEVEPEVSPDGKSLVFTAKQGDGQAIARLTLTTAATMPACP